MKLRAVLLASLFAALPVVASIPAQAMLQQDAIGRSRFIPPAQPLLLTRTLWRNLQDGQQIIVRRSYIVQFLPENDGFRLEGRQVDSSVEAPPRLEAIAAVERGRSDNGMFPLLLDATGQIRYAGDSLDLHARQQGETALLNMLGQAALSDDSKAEAISFIRQLIATGGAAAWPRDLFNPARDQQQEERRITLAGGSEGKVIVTVQAHHTAPSGLPEMVERTIITELDGTTRTSREVWTLRTP